MRATGGAAFKCCNIRAFGDRSGPLRPPGDELVTGSVTEVARRLFPYKIVGRPILAAAAFPGGLSRLRAGLPGRIARPTARRQGRSPLHSSASTMEFAGLRGSYFTQIGLIEAMSSGTNGFNLEMSCFLVYSTPPT